VLVIGANLTSSALGYRGFIFIASEIFTRATLCVGLSAVFAVESWLVRPSVTRQSFAVPYLVKIFFQTYRWFSLGNLTKFGPYVMVKPISTCSW